jgi:uncharacterized membrane protein
MLNLMILVTALGAGLIGGVFYGFSSFVMKSLAALPPAQGVAAMQSISVVVINPSFMTPFVGTALLSGVLLIISLLRWHDAGSAWLLAGSLLYIVGCFGVTAAFNVPMNDALAAVTPTSAEAATLWSTFVPTWTTWNTVRTLASLAAATAFILALGAR